MGKKLYRPIVKDGDHLVKSRENKGRVRGISQDENNKTTDIVEWEEVEVEELPYDYSAEQYEPQYVELTPEQKVLAEAMGHAVADIVIYGARQLNEHVIKPWWHKNARPWIKGKTNDIKHLFSGKAKVEKLIESKHNSSIAIEKTNYQIDEILDEEFNSIQFDMNSSEAKQHVMKLIYHMLGIAYEIKVLSNTRIIELVEDEKTRIANQAKAENLLAEKVSKSINELLSDDKLMLDVSTSKQLFSILGGGIKLNGEYIPVEVDKVSDAIDAMHKQIGKQSQNGAS